MPDPSAADRGRDLVEYYSAEETDAPMYPDDFRAAAVDIITDVLAALTARGIDPLAAHAIALSHYNAERHAS